MKTLMQAFLLLVASTIGSAQCPVTSWAAMATVGGTVDAMIHWDPDGPGPSPELLVVGGLFNSIGGVSASNVASFDGVGWQALATGTDNRVKSLAVYNGEVIAGGQFWLAGGTPAGSIARWNGSSWQPLGPGLTGTVTAMTVYNGDLIAAGNPLSTPGLNNDCVGRWDGTAWHSLTSMGPTLAGVNALAVHNGYLIAAGVILFIGGVPAQHLALWNGTQWFGSTTGPDQQITSMTVWKGDLIVAGLFVSPHTGITRFDGVNWWPLGTGLRGNPGLFPEPYALASLNGELVAAGSFTIAGGTPVANIARWNGTCWQGMGSGLSGAPVKSLLVHEGALLAGGSFTSSGAVPLSGFARWAEPNPVLALSQPSGPGSGVIVTNANLITGHEYYNVASFQPCLGCLGSGTYGGLCFGNLSSLYLQLGAPVGVYPFHFLAPAPSVSSGPYTAPIGMAFDAVCGDVTSATPGCLSRVVRFTVY
jgi:hypothetical protein